jgi:Holliday junction resolvasome RuvABC ATP-dependent DNA helicase subunit
MSKYFDFIRAATEGYPSIRDRIIRESKYQEFDVDFEVYLVTVFAIYIDGKGGREEYAFLQQLAAYLNWSDNYQRLMENKIQSRAQFSYEDIIIAKRHPDLAQVLYGVAYVTARVDGTISQDEDVLLQNLAFYLFGSEDHPKIVRMRQLIDQLGKDHIDHLVKEVEQDSVSTNQTPPPPPKKQPASQTTNIENEPAPSVDACLKELDALVGLDTVKQEVRKLISFLTIQKEREKRGLPIQSLTLHLVFTGNPGTGKTTVARIVAKIYNALGFLARGHLIETDRSGLVAQFVGQTAPRTNMVIDEALDGILFIDEAYALYRDTENDFGSEAVDTLVKRMEDDRKRLVVIAAGYHDEMTAFVESNPGLRSRFNTFIDFPDYAATELVQIYQIFCAQNGYRLEEDAKEDLHMLFEQAIQQKRRAFGNGRYVRNVFEYTLKNQAMRLVSLELGNLEKDDLILLKRADLSGINGEESETESVR